MAHGERSEASEETLNELISTMEIAQTLDPTATIVPQERSTFEAAMEAMTEALTQEGPAFNIKDTLGEGGMGIVHLAEQRTLGRLVAIKMLRSDEPSEQNKLKLLREGWITGALEHPNIVPVHDISTDLSGLPQIVFKRISGVSWQLLIDSPEEVSKRFQPRDVLEWHLRTLISVCNAIAFAHSRGIVHRDIKPENIMVGEFGEVYVLDWGIAVSTSEDGSGRFPSAKSATSMAGTPVYMAPEMLGGKVSGICAQTDVYLIGGVLFHILTGSAPHEGETMREIITNVALRNPSLPDSAPEELLAVLERALKRVATDRYESVTELRDDVANFLEHRGSITIADAAHEKLSELHQLLAQTQDYDQTHRGPILQKFSECRFGFQAALDAWPQNVEARQGLTEAFETVISFESQHGEPRNAESLLVAFPEASKALRASVQEQVISLESRQSELEKLDQDRNTATGSRTRSFFVLIGCVGWTALPLLWDTNADMFIWTGLFFLAVVGALTAWARESMLQTRINRGMVGTFSLVLILRVILGLLAKFGAIELFLMKTNFVSVWVSSIAMFGILVDRRVLFCIPPAMIAIALGLRYPNYMQEFSSCANFSVFLIMAIIWVPWKNDPFGRERHRRRVEDKRRAKENGTKSNKT